MSSPLFGEFMGTLVLILLGNGVVANVMLKRSKADGAGDPAFRREHPERDYRHVRARLRRRRDRLQGRGSGGRQWTPEFDGA